MYDGKIYTPTTNDFQKCFDDYMADVQRRKENNQLKQGENVKTDENGKIQVSGTASVMTINGLIAKIVFDKNPDREFYIEESFPLDWMYPYLQPHGLIFKINRQPLDTLPADIVQQDHDYWTKLIQPMIGDWLTDDTSIDEIAQFADKVFRQHKLAGFTGDPQYVQNDWTCKSFAFERSHIADLYAWRAKNATTPEEKKRMEQAADFAYRQSMALCPCYANIAVPYINFLMSQNRKFHALTMVETAAKIHPAPQLTQIIANIKKIRAK